jgi:hypothetical protein
MLKTLYHSLYWAEDIMNRFYMRGARYLPARILLKAFMRYVKHKVDNLRPKLEEMIHS